jgi:GNAT superfamily N-acetyltransferase
MTITLRAMTAADIPGGLRLCRASGWNQLEDDWRMVEGWLAEREGVVIGTSALMRYDKLAWVAMMLVDPAERRGGIGSRLLAEALAAARGAECVGLDATPLGEPLYRRHDFVPDYSLARLKCAVQLAPTGAARPMKAADLPAVFRTDREVFGADRSRLLASLFERAPECAWIVDGRGYCFGRPGYLYHQLGPVVATDRDAARALVSHCLARPGGRTFAIDVPRSNAILPGCNPDEDWLAWLKSAGCVEERSFTRMFLRGHRHPGIPSRQYAICGPEFA